MIWKSLLTLGLRRAAGGLARRLLASSGSSGTVNPLKWLFDWAREWGGESDSGVVVNGKTAMRYAPVWYAVNKIAGNLSQLPLCVHERVGEHGRRRAASHPAYRLLKKRPNKLMSATLFKETLQFHALIHGNGRAWIGRDLRGDPVELIPLLPDRTKTCLINGEKWHVTEIVTTDGKPGEKRWLRDRDVLHIAGLGYDGITGYALHEFAKNSLGLGLSTEKHINRYFKKDSAPGLILEAPAGMFRDEDEARQFLHQFNAAHEGLDNAHRTALLREGIKANKLGMSGRDAQWLEQRRFQRQEVALWFLLEAILGDDSSVSYNSLEQKNLAYLINCLNRWLVKWEEECDEKLLREREKATDSHYCKFITGALLRSDTLQTLQAGQIGVASRILNPNEVRAWLEMEPYEGGDEYANPAITPGESGEGRVESGEGDDDGTPPASRSLPSPAAERGRGRGAVERQKELIVGRLAELATVEQSRVRAAVARGGNFVSWCDKFYQAWPATLGRAIQGVGGAEWMAGEFAADSQAELLNAAGRATDAAGLAAEVDQLLSTWPARVAALAQQIETLEGVTKRSETEI